MANHFSVTFDAKMNIGQVKSAIGDMKKSLAGLKLPPNLEKKMEKYFSDMSSELENFESLTSKDIKSVSDFNKIEKSGEKIIDTYQKIKREMMGISGLSDSEKKNFFPPEITKNIQKATEALTEYKKKSSEIQNEINKNQKAIDKKNSFDKLDGKKILADEEYKELQKQLSEAVDRRRAIREEIERKKSGEPSVDFSGNTKLSKAEVKRRESYSKMGIEELGKAADKAQQQVEKLNNELNSSMKQSEANKAEIELLNLEDAAKKAETEIKRLTDLDASNLDKVFSVLGGIKEINLDEFSHDVAGATQATEKLTKEGFKQFQDGMSKIKQSVDGSEGVMENFEEDMRNAGRAVEEADSRFGDLTALKSRVTMFLSFGTAVRLFQRAIRSSFETIKELDATMTETAVVTDFSVGDMWDQLPKYTKMANELGVTTNDAYKAATLYYQQGLSTNEVMAVSNETLKMARIAGIDAADATDYMTAALRGFNMEIDENSAQRVNDVYSELAAVTASDTQELSIAMSKTASIASNANMEFENTAALLAQIIETTREAPETAGTAMKTIIARFSEVKELFSQGQLMGTDEEGEEININKIDAALKSVGISLKSFLRGEVGLDDILLELASKWDTLDLATQRYIATTAAGSRQQSRFLAMMSNYGRTMELVDSAYNSSGAGQEQFEKTLDSMETALNRLKNAWDQFAMGILNSDLAKGGIGALTGLLEIINSLTDGMGSLGGAVAKIGIAFGAFQLGRGFFDNFFSGLNGEKPKSIAGKNLRNFVNIGKDFKEDLVEQTQETLDRPTGRKLNFKKAFSNFIPKDNGESIQEALKENITNALKKKNPNIGNEELTNLVNEGLGVYGDGKKGAKDVTAWGKEKGIKFSVPTIDQTNFEQTTAKVQALSVVAGLAGAAMLKLGSSLEEAGHTKAATVFNGLGTALMAVTTVVTTLATILPALTAAFPALGTAIRAAGLTGLSGWLWVAAIVAVIAAVAFTAYKIGKAIKANTISERIKSAEEATARAKEEAEKAQSAYDELLSSKQSYNDMQSALDGLTRGTQEWTTALSAANQQVIDLVDKYPKLAEYLEIGDKGQLSITDEGWDYADEAGKKGVQNSQVALLTNQLELEKLQAEKAEKVLYDEITEKNEDPIGNFFRRLSDDRIKDAISGENFAEVFKSEDNAQIKQLAGDLGMASEDVYDMKGAFATYNAALARQQATQATLAESLLNASASEEALSYQYSDKLMKGIADNMSTDDYDMQIKGIQDALKDTKGDLFQDLAEQYGVIDDLEGNQQADLETLYAAMKNVDVESVTEADLSVKELTKEIAAMSQGEKNGEVLDNLTQAMQEMGEDSERQLANLLSGEITDLTAAEIENMDVAKLGADLTAKLESLGADPNETMRQLGYDNMNAFINSWDKAAVAENYAKNIVETLNKTRKYSQKTGEKFGEEQANSLLADFELNQQRFKDMGLSYQSMVNDIFSSLELAEDQEFASAGWQAFQKMINKPDISAKQITAVSDWMTSIDWSNPIEGAYALGEGIKSTNKDIQEVSKSMKEVGDSTFDAASQMDYFLNSGDYTSIKEDLADIIDAGEEITGSDIRGLTKNYKNLDKMLKNTGMSASALGKTLTMVNEGTLKSHQLTNNVLSAFSAFGQIEDLTNSVIESISNFDAGVNEGEITNFIKTSHEAVSELMNSNLSGSQQIGNYLDYWFGSDWDAGITTADAYIDKINQLNGILGQNQGNMNSMWQNFLAGKGPTGEKINFDDLKEFGITVSNGEVTLSPSTDLEDYSKGLQKLGYTKNMADAMLASEIASDPQFMLDLRNAELPKAVTKLTEGAGTVNDLLKIPSLGDELLFGNENVILDESEVQAVADFYGKKLEEVIPLIKDHLVKNGQTLNLLDLYDESGQISDTEGAFKQIGQALGFTGENAGEKFQQGFQKKVNGKNLLNLGDFDKTLKQLRISEEGQQALTKGLVEGIQNGAVQGIQYLSDITGKMETIDLGENFDFSAPDALEQIQEKIAESEAALELKVDSDKIRDGIIGALTGITFKVDPETGNVTAEVSDAVDEADGTPTINQPDSSPVTSAINNGIAAANKKVTLQIGQTGLEGVRSAINGLVNRAYSITIGVSYSGGTGANGGPIASYRSSNSTQRQQHQGAGNAKGVKNASSSYISLTGEEGPELHQLANGGYYITGTTGPSIDYVNRGDTIYTAEETQKILSGRRRSITRKNFMPGQNNNTEQNDGTVTHSPGGGSSSSSSSTSSKSSSSSTSTTSNKAASNSKEVAKNTEKAADDAEKWENSFDHLYNLTQDINAELRVRNRLEREYKKALDQAIPSGKELAAITYSQVWHLEKAKKQQEEMLELREKQMRDYQSENSDLNQYGWFNWKDMTVEINWDLINGVTDKEQGDKIEEYINKLEEIQDQMEDAQDAIDDIYDDLQEIVERGDKANQELQDRVLDALIDKEQEQIDLQEKTNQAINDAASDLHDAISRNIDKMRRDRDNEKTKEDITEKERRLAYLRMDTTGGNAVEIKRLEKEIKEQRQDFNDSLVDQALSDMQEQNEEAADQRQRQVELMEGVLDYQKKIGYFADRALDIVEKGVAGGVINKNSDLYKLLVENNNDYWEQSVASRQESLNKIASLIAEKYAADKKVEQDRSLYNGGYLERMTKASSAEDFQMAEEARNKYINEHPEEGWHTSGLSDAYGVGIRNDIGYEDPDLYGTYDAETKTWSGGIDWQAKINEALENKEYELAATYEGFRDKKIQQMRKISPDYVKEKGLKETYGAQAAKAYAQDTQGKTFSGSYGEGYYHPASHSTYETLVESKEKYNNEDNASKYVQIEPDDGGWMSLVQDSIYKGDFDAAYYYAKKRDAKTTQTGEDYDEPNTYQYVYNIEKGYASALEKAEQYYKNGIEAGYDSTDYMQKIEDEMNKSKPNWKDIFTWAGQRDYKLQTDEESKKYWNGNPKQTWDKIFPKWPKKFKTGGLVKGTGLAWLDGTPSHPEYVLNAGQTQAFLRLSDMISGLTSSSNQQFSGDTYIDVDITVDQIASDYDVEAAADKVKQILYQDAMYRNVNRVNFLK